ncbi:hypothetical protein VTJ83DRAFT_2597 [Remersonia thermophila]|uniref:Uncharacterized protein n=1 Tax=Remersonia thermophila TaxID=72144 RepID=A0ABR4DJ61_9PEZI
MNKDQNRLQPRAPSKFPSPYSLSCWALVLFATLAGSALLRSVPFPLSLLIVVHDRCVPIPLLSSLGSHPVCPCVLYTPLSSFLAYPLSHEIGPNIPKIPQGLSSPLLRLFIYFFGRLKRPRRGPIAAVPTSSPPGSTVWCRRGRGEASRKPLHNPTPNAGVVGGTAACGLQNRPGGGQQAPGKGAA